MPLPLEIETEEDEFWVNGDRTYGYNYCAGNMAGNGKATRDEIDILVYPQDSHGSSESLRYQSACEFRVSDESNVTVGHFKFES